MTVVGAVATASILLVLIAYGAGMIGGPGVPPKVTVVGVHWQIDGVSDCTVTITYALRNEGNVKAYVDIDYLDNDWVVAHDFYIVQANSERSIEYGIEHADCVIDHDYEVRVAAVS